MRIVVASFLSAIVLFFFGFLWWGIAMPGVKPAEVISDPNIVAGMSGLETNVHIHPDYANPDENYSGPTVMLYYIAETPAMGKTLALGFAHMFVTALMVSLLISKLALKTFAGRLATVVFLGVFVAFWADAGNYIWWHHPPTWAVYHFFYDSLSWVLAGLVIAGLSKNVPREVSIAE